MIRSAEEAFAAAAEGMPGYHAIDVAISGDGRAALTIDARGRVLLVLARRRRAVARDVDWAALRAVYDGMLVETGDRRIGTVLLRDVDALDVRRLGQPAITHPAHHVWPDEVEPEGALA